MKNIFKEYHITDKENYNQLLKNSIIVLDANALLNLYRFNSDNKDKFFEILDKVKERLYMTYQIGNEFYNNRETVITDTYSFRDDLKKYITDNMKKFYNDIENINLGKGARTLLKYEEDLKKELMKIIETSEKNLTDKLDTFQPNITKDYLNEDNILDRLINLYEGRVGKALSDTNLNKIYKDGAIRYKDKIPPGYEDEKTKQGNNKYGDLVIWNEMINYSKEEKKDILFVSNDLKNDWMQRIKGKTIGPRKELLQEFKKETEGQLFYAISGSNFIEKMSELYDVKDIKELEEENNKIAYKTETYTYSFQEYEQLLKTRQSIYDEINMIESNYNSHDNDFDYYCNYSNAEYQRDIDGRFAYIDHLNEKIEEYENIMIDLGIDYKKERTD